MQQPEITREWLAEQLALCERHAAMPSLEDSLIDDDWRAMIRANIVLDSAFSLAARTGYPLLLRKLMEAMERDEKPATEVMPANEYRAGAVYRMCPTCGGLLSIVSSST